MIYDVAVPAADDGGSADEAGSSSPRAGDSLRRSGIGSGLIAGLMGVDTAERTNPLSPAEAAALGERPPEGPFTYYIVLGEYCIPWLEIVSLVV